MLGHIALRKVVQQQLDELNAQISELEAKAQAGSAELGKKYEEQVSHLSELSGSAKKKIEAAGGTVEV